jgi:hypothetical protein
VPTFSAESGKAEGAEDAASERIVGSSIEGIFVSKEHSQTYSIRKSARKPSKALWPE